NRCAGSSLQIFVMAVVASASILPGLPEYHVFATRGTPEQRSERAAGGDWRVRAPGYRSPRSRVRMAGGIGGLPSFGPGGACTRRKMIRTATPTTAMNGGGT